VRAKITVSSDIEEKELKELVLQDEKVLKWIEGRSVKKFVFVPKKLVSIVV